MTSGSCCEIYFGRSLEPESRRNYTIFSASVSKQHWPPQCQIGGLIPLFHQFLQFCSPSGTGVAMNTPISKFREQGREWKKHFLKYENGKRMTKHFQYLEKEIDFFLTLRNGISSTRNLRPKIPRCWQKKSCLRKPFDHSVLQWWGKVLSLKIPSP